MSGNVSCFLPFLLFIFIASVNLQYFEIGRMKKAALLLQLRKKKKKRIRGEENVGNNTMRPNF